MKQIRFSLENKFKSFLYKSTVTHNFTVLLLVISLFTACGDLARTLNPDDIVTTPPTSDVSGYYYPAVISHYPTSAGITSTTSIVIIFNMAIETADLDSAITINDSTLGLLSPGVHYSLNSSVRSVTITFLVSLTVGDTVTIDVGTGIHDLGGTVTMNSSPPTITYTITSAASTDSDSPSTTVMSPLSGSTGISRNLGSVYVTFDEDIDFSTVDSSSFYLTDTTNSKLIPSSYSYDPLTHRLYLYPTVQLEPLAVHTVTVTSAITDLSGNSLTVPPPWTFTTAGLSVTPLTLYGPVLTGITQNSFTLSWSTSTISWYTLSYGRDNSVSSSYSPGSVYPDDFTSAVSYTVTSPTIGKRYWYNLECRDKDNNAATGTLTEINLFTSEVPTIIHNDSNDQGGFRAIEYYNPADAGPGIAAFWKSGSNAIYGQVLDDAGFISGAWNSGSPMLILSGTNISYLSAFNDGVGGVVVLAAAGGNVLAKRIDSDGSTIWGGASGFAIGAGTAASGAVVYTGIFNNLLSGNVDMGGLSMSGAFFEDLDIDGGGAGDTISDYAANGDIIYDRTSFAHAFIIKTAGVWDHQYVLGQSSAVYANYGTPHSYTLADITATATDSVTDHTTNTGAYSENDQTLYLSHGSAGSVNAGDIVLINGSYARVDAVIPVSFTPVNTATETERISTHLYDVNGNFTGIGLNQYDVVRDTTVNAYAIVTGAVSNTSDLTLSDAIFTAAEDYSFYPRKGYGTADWTSGDGYVFDAGVNFNSFVTDGDLIFSVNSTYTAITGGPSVITSHTVSTLNFGSGLVFSSGEEYIIVSQTPLAATGKADNGGYLLINSGASWAATVAAGDLVRNTNVAKETFSYVTEVSNTVLKLADSRFDGFFGSLDTYEIYHEFCKTAAHITYDDQVASFTGIQLDVSISMANGDPVQLYGTRLTWTADSTSAVFPSNTFYENDADLSSLGLISTASGDMVLNCDTGSIATIDQTGYAIHPFAMRLSNSIFSDNQAYRIYRFNWANTYMSNMSKSGISGTANADHLTGTTADFGITTTPIGAVAYNVDDDTYSQIVDIVNTNSLLLSNNIFSANNVPYLVSNRSGLFIAYQQSDTIYGRIVSLNLVDLESDPVVLKSVTLTSTGVMPYVIPDGNGNAYFVYRSTGTHPNPNSVMINYLDGNLSSLWAGEQLIDTDGTVQELLDVRSDDHGGVIILYTSSGGIILKVQRILSSGARYWSATGRTVTTVSGATTGHSLAIHKASMDETIPDASNDAVIVAWMQSGEIFARRIAGTSSSRLPLSSPTSGVQRYPSVYINDTGDKVFVVWEDNRFLNSLSGWGTFGVKLTVAGDVLGKDPNWDADASHLDTYGVAVLQHNFNYLSQYPVLFPYNNNAGVCMFWIDFEVDANGGDLLYMKPLSTTYLPLW